MAKKESYKIPFDKDGNLMHQYSGWHLSNGAKLEDNHKIVGTLTYDCISYSWTGSPHFIFKREDGRKIHFLKGRFDEVVPHMCMGKIDGVFTYVKQGQAYGCKLISVCVSTE